MSSEIDWQNELDEAEKARKMMEDFCLKNGIKAFRSYLALKLWVYVLENNTEMAVFRKPVESVIEQAISNVTIKEDLK